MPLFGKLADIYMYKGFTLGMTLRCSPYIVNPTSMELSVTKSSGRLFMWILNWTILLGYLLALLHRLQSYMTEPAEDKIKRMPLIVGGTALCSFTIFLHLSTFMYLRELPVLLEQFKNFFREYQEDFVLSEGNKKRRLLK
ncbi:unnamed protein product, partial [Allacma fusca]